MCTNKFQSRLRKAPPAAPPLTFRITVDAVFVVLIAQHLGQQGQTFVLNELGAFRLFAGARHGSVSILAAGVMYIFRFICVGSCSDEFVDFVYAQMEPVQMICTE